jgi:hypothetical protein
MVIIVVGGCCDMEKEENVKSETSILLFEFEEKVHPGVTITYSEDIKFLWDEKDATAVTGFEITIKPSNEEKITNAKEQTDPSLANILSGVTGSQITYKPPQVKIIKNG